MTWLSELVTAINTLEPSDNALMGIKYLCYLAVGVIGILVAWKL